MVFDYMLVIGCNIISVISTMNVKKAEKAGRLCRTQERATTEGYQGQ
jgi:hypothetical protein